MEKKLTIIGGLITVIGGFYAGYSTINSIIETHVSERVEPYEQLLEGLSLSQYGNHEKAIEKLDRALTTLLKGNPSESTLVAIVDPYLNSLADSDNPAEHWPGFQKVLPILEKKIPITGERKMHIAWVYLYTGDVAVAHDNFVRSIKLYEADNDSTSAAESYWGLSLCELAKGDIDTAVEHFLKAEEKNPFAHSVVDTIKSKEWFPKQWWVMQLARMNEPVFENSINAFYIQLAEIQKEREKVEP